MAGDESRGQFTYFINIAELADEILIATIAPVLASAGNWSAHYHDAFPLILKFSSGMTEFRELRSIYFRFDPIRILAQVPWTTKKSWLMSPLHLMTKSIYIFPFLFTLLLTSKLQAAPGDADNDGLRDAVETNTGIFVSAQDTGTHPSVADSDGDSMPDGMELRVGTNPVSAASNVKRPNIILINCDDLGYGDIGCFWQNQRTGTRKFATPNLDDMAAQGAMMTHHYVGAPICASSRASLMQGRHQGHSDIRDRMFDVALPNNHSIASVLKASGYQTIHVGKAGLTGNSGTSGRPLPANPLFRGFNRFFGYPFHTWAHEHYPRNGTTSFGSFIYDDNQKITGAHRDLYSSDAWTGFAKKTIIEETTSNPNRPFFLYVAYDTPHFIGQTPPTRDYPTGRGITGGIQWTGAPSYVNTAVNDPARVDNPANMHPSVDPAWPLRNQHHVTMIRRLDDSVADILQTLRDLNIADNTLVVFTSDNGPDSFMLNTEFFQGYAGFEGEKQQIWEGGIRVPTIAWWPGKIPATNQSSNIRRIANPSANYDWLATFAEMALAPIPSYTDGASVLPDLTGQGSRNAKDYLYFEFWTGGFASNYADWPNHRNEVMEQMQAIRIGDFMGVRTNVSSGTEAFKICNVVTDPKQGIDLSPSRPDLQQRMKYLSLAARRPLQVWTVPSANRPYSTTPLPALPPIPVRNGIKWKAYEGYWPWLPEFRHLTPVSSGDTPNLTTSILSRANDVGAKFEAYISIPTTGTYTFQLSANSNCNLWIHESHIIDNDYNFTATKTSGPVYLAAGLHPIRLYYRHQTGTPALELKYSGPGISLQTVPASSLFLDGPPAVFSLQTDTSITKRNQPVLVDALANDSSNYPIALASAGSSSSISTSLNGGSILFSPSNGFFGSTTIPYTVSTGTATATSFVTTHVLIDDEIWIPCNEGTGSSVNGVSPSSSFLGNLTGASVPDASWITGKSGKALRFDGDNDQVNFPGLGLPSGSSPRTFSCWMRTSNTLSAEIQTLFSYGGQSPGGLFAARIHNIPGVTGNHPARLEVNNGTIIGTKPINDGLWHHIAIVVQDTNNNSSLNVSEAKIYVDGVADAITTTVPMVINTGNTLQPCLGGSNHATNHHYNGDIDDIRIFPKAFTALEIADLHRTTINLVTGPEDLDGDGATTSQEMIAGTDPGDPDSVFKIKSTTYTGQNFLIRWSAVSGKTYIVEESISMASWKPVTNLAPYTSATDNPDATILVPADSQPAKFYRLSVR